jgi:hypothetical protein
MVQYRFAHRGGITGLAFVGGGVNLSVLVCIILQHG